MTEKKKLQVQQNSALRAVCNADYGCSTAKLLSDVGVDSVNVSIKKASCKLVYKGLNNMGPKALNDMFSYHIPTRDLRSINAQLSEVPRCKTQFGTKNLAVRGAGYWNVLPYHIKVIATLEIFKQNIKLYTGFG